MQTLKLHKYHLILFEFQWHFFEKACLTLNSTHHQKIKAITKRGRSKISSWNFQGKRLFQPFSIAVNYSRTSKKWLQSPKLYAGKRNCHIQDFWQKWHLLRVLWRHYHSMAKLRQEKFRQIFLGSGKGNFPTWFRRFNGMSEKLTSIAMDWKNRGNFCIKWSFYSSLQSTKLQTY